MSFEVNTETKTITLVENIKLTDFELIKQLLGDTWKEWTVSFRPIVIDNTKWIFDYPWRMSPIFVGPDIFGPSRFEPNIWCAAHNKNILKVTFNEQTVIQ